MSALPYLMESAGEGARLRAQEAANPSLARLRATGLREGDRALDAGCGAGAVTSAIAEIVGPRGTVVGMDPNPARLALARNALQGVEHVRFREGALPDTQLPAESFDYVWSQYVFEYLPDPAQALRELIRVTRPGGRVVVAEIDAHGLHNWPVAKELEQGCAILEQALRQAHFDLYIGRKLFRHFTDAGLADVRVHLTPFYVVAGAADERLLEDWRIRFDALAPIACEAFGGKAEFDAFARAYLAMLAAPDVLKYAVILTTEGRRP